MLRREMGNLKKNNGELSLSHSPARITEYSPFSAFYNVFNLYFSLTSFLHPPSPTALAYLF